MPLTHRVRDFEDDHQLRRVVFKHCLLPEDWKAWYQAGQAAGK